MIILKVTKNQGFTLCLEDTIFEKHSGGGSQIDLSNCFRVKRNGRMITADFKVNASQNCRDKKNLLHVIT